MSRGMAFNSFIDSLDDVAHHAALSIRTQLRGLHLQEMKKLFGGHSASIMVSGGYSSPHLSHRPSQVFTLSESVGHLNGLSVITPLRLSRQAQFP